MQGLERQCVSGRLAGIMAKGRANREMAVEGGVRVRRRRWIDKLRQQPN